MTTQGQILDGSQFGAWIDKIITDFKPNTIVEIGTWKGLGSTKRIIDSVIKNNYSPKFLSLESNFFFYQTAVSNLDKFSDKVELIWGRLVKKEDVERFVANNPITEEMKRWLSSDINDYLKCDDVTDKIPTEIDFLLLDGGEFSTYDEWVKLKDRTTIVALDDSRTLKCKQIREELLNDQTYELIIDSSDRNGFTIFRKK